MSPLPPWVWRYKQRAEQVCKLLERLIEMGPGPIYDNSDKTIEIHEMDFVSGETDESLADYFTPDKDTEFKIANTTLDPNNPADDKFSLARKLKTLRGIHLDTSNMQDPLCQSFSNYIRKSPHGTTAPYPWEFTKMNGKNGWLFSSSDKHGFTIENGATCIDTRCSHQLVVMKSNRLEAESQPSVGELFVLVTWIMAGIEPQMSHLKKRARLEHHELFNLHFPTMVISFLPDARARILYGYFDEGRLKVAYTPAINFDSDDYATKMDILLQWAWPQVNFDTTKPIPLTTIEDDEEDEWSEWESLTEESDSDSEWETDSECEIGEESDTDWEWETDEEMEDEGDQSGGEKLVEIEKFRKLT